jgi:sporulation protein YlmC with PRC-barrel domain
MADHEIHLELLLSKQVLDQTGKAIGRIQEIHAEKQGDEWVVREYIIGAAAVIERLSAWSIALRALQLFGARVSRIDSGHIIPWDKLDLKDLEKPKLLCDLHELQKLSDQKQKAQDTIS